MPWPQPTEFNEAIQNPHWCFRDSELREAQVVEDALGMPRPYSGNFADVYQLRGPNGKAWAVKCFTRAVGSLQARYQAISDHLRQGSPPFMVDFQYLTEGIRIRDQWYPVVKMDWVEGFTLNEFIRRHADKPQVIYSLAQMWIKLSLQLRRAAMAHGDLQHGNVLLVPGERASQLSLRLIDYDGMYVPTLADIPSGEMGHPNFQHPQRLREGIYSSEVDRFPHLLIYTALRALAVGGRDLWDKYDNGENLLFRERDIAASAASALLLDLWQLPDPDLRPLLGHLLLGSVLPLNRVVMLDEVVGGEGRPSSLTPGQQRQLEDLLPAGAARVKTPTATVSRLTLEELLASEGGEPPEVATQAGNVAVAQPQVETLVAASLVPAPPAPRQADHYSLVQTTSTTRTSVRNLDTAQRPLFLPALNRPCPHCGEQKHLLQSRCPQCNKVAWTTVACASLVVLAAIALAMVLLPANSPGLAGILGFVAALISILTIPILSGMLAHALQEPQIRHPAVGHGLRWPSPSEPCIRCGNVDVFQLFICRQCGQLHGVRLAIISALAVTMAMLVAISQPKLDVPGWWETLTTLTRWLGRFAGAALAGVLFLGIYQAWKLQTRLPKENRVRSVLGRLALLTATLLPLVCFALLIYSLFTWALLAHARIP